jgi:hypothetical protein
MRNTPKPLDRATAEHAYRVRDRLQGMPEDAVIVLAYVKRSGEASATVGTIAGFSGKDGMDTMSVTLDSPTKGYRTINLAGVTAIQEVEDPPE